MTVILPPISNEMEASNTIRPPAEPPEVTDASTLGGWVWVVLFGLVMTLSVLANLVLVISVLQMKKKKTKPGLSTTYSPFSGEPSGLWPANF